MHETDKDIEKAIQIDILSTKKVLRAVLYTILTMVVMFFVVGPLLGLFFQSTSGNFDVYLIFLFAVLFSVYFSMVAILDKLSAIQADIKTYQQDNQSLKRD